MVDSVGQLIFFLLTPLSHIGASLFFAKPRFCKWATAAIWLLYVVLMMILPPDTPTANFFLSLAAHLILFFVTTTGSVQEKGFLFFSYASIFTCFGTMFTVVNTRLQSEPAKCVFALVLMTLMQVLLYAVLLPAFRKVAPYIHAGWAKFYAVVLSFFALVVMQTAVPVLEPMSGKELAVFLLTILAFCITYVSMFASMKNMVELTREKQRKTHAELLLTQVQSQMKEAELVRQNRHDMRHHNQMLLAYAESGDLEHITDYLKRHTEHIEAITTGRFCENETVNNILKVYHQKAAEQTIAMEIRAAAKPGLSADAPDLVAIVANVLENALHGAAESESEAPFIHVSIKHQAGRLLVSCDNACVKSLHFEEMPDYLKGIGIQSITATADKYGGSCRFSAKGGVFRCMVVMDE
jgi:hypothetical protein